MKMEKSPFTCLIPLRICWLALVSFNFGEALMVACAFHGLTAVILPFTASTHSSPSVPDDVIDMIKVAKPQVLILPAGLATEDLKQIGSIKGLVVVDISSAPHMDWSEEDGGVPVQTWTSLLDSATHFEPTETAAAVAIQSFTKAGKGYKSIEFTQRVQSRSLKSSNNRMSSLLLRVS